MTSPFKKQHMSALISSKSVYSKKALRLLLPLSLLLVSIMLALGLGSVYIPFSEVLYCLTDHCSSPINSMIVQDIRLPRVLLALFAGAGLAVAGAVLQNSTNNSLADPYLFGIVSGAGLGAILYNVLNVQLGTIGMSLFAFIGALLSVTLVMSVAISKTYKKTETLILTGVAVSFMLAAASQFLLYISEPMAANRIIFWLMGSVAFANAEAVAWVSITVISSSTLLWLLRDNIDALLLGDEQAKSLGVNVDLVRVLALLITSAMTAIIVAFCGGIGFVGLMIPHIIRWFGFVKMRQLLPMVFVVGAAFLIWVDVIARVSITNQEIPLGVITSACGSLFFLLILKRRVS